MAEGIEVEIQDGFAHIQFLDPSKRGDALTKLLDQVGPGLIDVDTRSNPRKTYIVPEGVARDAGLLDEAEPAPETPALPEGTPSDSWTVAQLKEYAAQEEVDLTGAEKKADILAAIQAATPAQE